MCPPLILLVEDEPCIAEDLRAELAAAGYLVLAAPDAWQALQLAELYLPEFTILNFHYQNIRDGMALARALRSRYLTKVLFITGARPQDIEAAEYFCANYEVLYKPFTRHQLRRFLDDVTK